MHKYLFFVLILLCYTTFSMELTLTPPINSTVTPLIHSNDKREIILESDNTKTILRYALTTGPSTIGQKSALSLICKSWQTFCTEDADIIDHIKTVNKFNIRFIKDIFDPFHGHFYPKPSEEDFIKVANYSLFDVQATYTENINDRSLLIYSIEKKQYSLFETLLNLSYIIIRPIILEKIIFAGDIRFIELLKKYSFHFNRYHFAYFYVSHILRDDKYTYLICKVTYSQKKYSEKHAEKLLRWIIKKILFDHARCQQLNEESLKKFMKQNQK